jgi:hypothetical protein
MAQGYLIFHLNLAFSPIPAEARPGVIRKCYWPLLHLAEDTGIPIGIELTGWTLQQIASLDQSWVQRFRRMLEGRQCELIGSGWSQVIGPLVPYDVNRWNQKLGREAYQRMLGVTPRIALVNEMAFSTGMVEVYAEAGYEGIVMDRDNVRLALGIEDLPISATPTHAIGSDGESMPVLWSDSILFQKLQRYAHGDIATTDYVDYFRKRVAQGEDLFPLYCNDAEVFDYRPGRFKEERAVNEEGEWNRLERLICLLAAQEGVTWCTPSEAMQEIERSPVHHSATLSTVAQPLPVKKQAKYNIGRWAVTGRNDIWLNTLCHRLHRCLRDAGESQRSAADWRALCELWASDLRTHIELVRWEQACTDLLALAAANNVSTAYGSQSVELPGQSSERSEGFEVTRDDENIFLTVRTLSVHLVLNLRRGLTIHSLSFRSQDFTPVIGTLPHGFFSTIALGADYYSGGVIVELPGEHARITDLERVEPEVFQRAEQLLLQVQIETRCGTIVKTVSLEREGERVSLGYRFPGWKKTHSIVRTGIITLLPDAFADQLTLDCVNGGRHAERFVLDRACDHSAASSSLVSSTTGFGATTGEIVIGDGQRAIAITWDPSQCAVLPMLVHKQAGPQALTRLVFSICELDDTSRPEGDMPTFTLQLRAA